MEEATNDLLHTLGNFLGIVGDSCRAEERGMARFMSDLELGTFTRQREPELRAALDKLKHARNVERIEEDDKDHCSLCGQWKT